MTSQGHLRSEFAYALGNYTAAVELAVWVKPLSLVEALSLLP